MAAALEEEVTIYSSIGLLPSNCGTKDTNAVPLSPLRATPIRGAAGACGGSSIGAGVGVGASAGDGVGLGVGAGDGM